MANLHREDVLAVLGPIDEILVAEIIATGATQRDLVEAQAWVAADDALMDDGRPLPEGRAGALVAVLRRIEAEEDEPQ